MGKCMASKQLPVAQKSEEAQVAALAVEWYNKNVSSFAREKPESKLDKISISNVVVRQKVPGYYEVDIKGWGREPHEGPDLLFEKTSTGLVLRAHYPQHQAFFEAEQETRKPNLSGWKITRP